MKGNTMRIVVLGDWVGKTSLVCAIISDLSTNLPKTHKKVVLPPDMCAYSKDIFTQIVDTSSQTPLGQLAQALKTCNLALLVYDVSDPQSVIRLETHWMRIVSQHNRQLPVVLVGNKYDLVQLPVNQQKQYTPIRQVLRQLVKSFKQVQMGIQCSAYYDRNINKVLNSAQRAVLYPLPPLYDLNKKQITPHFRKALLRIFRILDTQLSGSLSDTDLGNLQQRVFQTQISPQDIRAIKNIISKQNEEQQSSNISVNGFIAFQKKCIQMLKIQICWSILRHFDYDNQLQIRNVDDTLFVSFEQGYSLQLSPDVVDFLNRVYRFAQVKKQQGQSTMEKLFQAAPYIPLQQFKEAEVQLQRFIYLWHMFTLIDYRQCYKALLYIGYDQKVDSCFTITKPKKTYSDLLKIKQRNNFCILFVDNQQFPLGQLFREAVVKQHLTRNVAIFSGKQNSKILIMFKIRQRHLHEFIKQNELSKRIDLIVYYSSQRALMQRVKPLLCQHVMTKQITRQIAQKDIDLYQLPKLNLQVFPIEARHDNIQRLLGYLLNIFEKFQQGYSKEYIQKLKNQSNRVKKVFIGVVSGLALLGIGAIAYSKRALLK